jgi:hypothetical protein
MSEHTDTERDAELFASLDDDSLRMLFPERFAGPLTVTLVHPPLDDATAARANELAGKAESTAAEPAVGGAARVQRSFEVARVEALHDYYTLIESTFGVDRIDILLDGQRVPMVRELWLPLLWLLRS